MVASDTTERGAKGWHMRREGSVTGWIGDLSIGKEAAAESLWARYFPRATRMVRRWIARGWRWRHPDDAEDVALSALHSLIGRVRDGRLVVRDGRQGWDRLLAVITRHKAARRFRRVEPHVAELEPEVLADPAPGPEHSVHEADALETLLVRLDGHPGELRRIAELSLAGYHQGEIARMLNVTRRTIVRRLVTIRTILKDSSPPGSEPALPSTERGEHTS